MFLAVKFLKNRNVKASGTALNKNMFKKNWKQKLLEMLKNLNCLIGRTKSDTLVIFKFRNSKVEFSQIPNFLGFKNDM